MPVIDQIKDLHDEITSWRRDLHAIPETAFEEFKTSDYVAGKLEEFGIEMHRGLAGTGIVATLTNGDGPAIGLRGDLDGLDVEESNDVSYRSTHPGKMHACGHDGHTAMLLGAARYLSANRNFRGTVRFIFQPAEENGGGGGVMVKEGLFDQFPVDSIYGMHNWPELPPGIFAIKTGAIQAAFDIFEITITGRGGHAAMPHLGADPIVAAGALLTGLQTITSRNVHPMEAAVVSVTQVHAGDTWNVIPNTVVLRGTTRSFNPDVQDLIEPAMVRLCQGIAAAHGIEAEVRYERRYPPTVNHEAQAEIAAAVAAEIVGIDNVERNPVPTMGGEDFSFMLLQRPGCYLWLGNGGAAEGRAVHTPGYMFNDDVLPLGVSFFARLVETQLA